MGDWVKLTAADGNELSAYVAKPSGEVRGGVVVVQEIFGVNPSIQGAADWLASEGYVAIAPAIFDRYEKDVQLGYDEASMKKAYELYAKLNPDNTLNDVAAAFEFVKNEGKGTAVLGFCYGGLTAWLSAARGPAFGFTPTCTVGYYAGGVGKVAAEAIHCPVMLHFGADDDHIGADQREAVAAAHPEVEIHVYDGAGHAFANPARPSFVAAAAKVADERSISFLRKHLG
ncbi:dienelactone hydrolase family protein [Granulicella cerasi]|uniref:Dienelactone hydrolase family protein n=1 Tax=Granulicella cerasi TaxID=741063 RepID=A0ABW1Z434_9BACT|nr:dienelactone hydrolase family protein [Granulicella cerasi]